MTWGNMLIASVRLLVVTPVILVKYNVNEIAFWYLLATINAFIIVIDFGFYPTFSRVISYAFNGLDSITNDLAGLRNKKAESKEPNWELTGRIYGTINSTYLIMGIIVFVLVFGATFFSMKEVIDKAPGQESEFWLTYVIFSIGTILGFLAKKFDSVIIGTGNIVKINRWDMMNNLLSVITSAIMLNYRVSLVYLALNVLFFAIVLIVRDYYLERAICNGQFKKFKFFSFDKEIFKWCWKPVWQSGVLIIASTGVVQATGMIYSHVSSAADLAGYLLTLRLVTTVAQFSQAPFYSKIPFFNGLRVQGEIPDLIGSTEKAITKSLLIFVLGMAVLIFGGNWVLHLIKSKSILVDSKILMLMAFVWFLERHHAMHAQIYVTTNKIPFYKTAIISGIINIGLMWWLLPSWGVITFPIAQGLSNVVINNWWNVKLSLGSLNIGFWNYFKKSALLPLIALLLIVVLKILIEINL